VNLGDAYKNNVLDYLYGGAPPTPPATVYLALYQVAPTSAGGGTEVPSANGYARVAVTNDGTSWVNPATGGTKDSGAPFTFPTATGSWGTVVAYAFHDDPVADSIVTFGDLTASVPISATETPQFNSGTITLDAA
jgi:hypothetical protein